MVKMIRCKIDFSISINARVNFSSWWVLEYIFPLWGKTTSFFIQSFCFCVFQICLRLTKMWHGAGPMMKAVVFNPGSRLRGKSTFAALNHWQHLHRSSTTTSTWCWTWILSLNLYTLNRNLQFDSVHFLIWRYKKEILLLLIYVEYNIEQMVPGTQA